MSQRQKYSNDEILEMLQECKRKHGKCSPDDFREEEDFCSVSLVTKRFGSWLDAKKEAGIDEDLSSETGLNKQYEDEQILSQLRELDRREGKCTTDLLLEQEDMMAPSVPIKRFGSWLKAKKKAGLKVEDERSENKRPQKYSDEDLLEALRECEEKHGKVSQRIFDNDPEFPSSGAVAQRFDGGWAGAKDQADLKTVGAGNQKYSSEELLEMLRECKEKYGNCTADRFASDDDFCSPETVQRRFGGWNNAKKQAENQG